MYIYIYISNVNKSAVVVFRNEKTFDGEWFWGNFTLPHLDNSKYLGVKFTYNGHWDTHIKEHVTAGKCNVNSLLRILNNPCLSLYVNILQPSLEYGSEVWRCTTSQSKALDAVLLAPCKKILGCSSKTCS